MFILFSVPLHSFTKKVNKTRGLDNVLFHVDGYSMFNMLDEYLTSQEQY